MIRKDEQQSLEKMQLYRQEMSVLLDTSKTEVDKARGSEARRGEARQNRTEEETILT